MHPFSCNSTYLDVTDLVNHRRVKNRKNWISSEQNTTFLQNKKILNLCFKWHILRSYCFVAEITFNIRSIIWKKSVICVNLIKLAPTTQRKIPESQPKHPQVCPENPVKHLRWNFSQWGWKPSTNLREKCPNTEFFLVRIFLYSDYVNLCIQSKYWKIRTRKNSVFCIWTLFM